MSDAHPSRQKLIDAAIALVRERGYADTKVDEICARAGIGKGSFFHHFKTKEDVLLASIDHWNSFTGEAFRTAPYRDLSDPLDRLLGYVEFRIAMLDMTISEFSCLLGTLVQEVYSSHPKLLAACDAGMSGHIDELVADVAAAKALYAPDAPFSAESLGYFIQAALQGSFIQAKARHGSGVARDNLAHVSRYLETIFPRSN
ncbi:MAG: TetR/AcrR family transcriptional regulator [Mesorhizobium sp.]